jgi:hypothetical protein
MHGGHKSENFLEGMNRYTSWPFTKKRSKQKPSQPKTPTSGHPGYSQLLINRCSNIPLWLAKGDIVFFIRRAIKDAQGFEIMSLAATILSKDIRLMGRRMTLSGPCNKEHCLIRAGRADHVALVSVISTCGFPHCSA